MRQVLIIHALVLRKIILDKYLNFSVISWAVTLVAE